MDKGAKMPPAGHWRAYKRRNVRGEYRDIAAHAGQPGGQKKARHGLHQWRAVDQDFFAVSQMIITGRARINRTIRRGSPPL